MSETPDYGEIRPIDDAYIAMMDSITEFFRFERRHPGTYEFDEAYYHRVGEVIKRRVDHELKYLKTPYLK